MEHKFKRYIYIYILMICICVIIILIMCIFFGKLIIIHNSCPIQGNICLREKMLMYGGNQNEMLEKNSRVKHE